MWAVQALGSHRAHEAAQLSEAHEEGKVSFAEDIQLVLQKSESAAQAMQVQPTWLTPFLRANRGALG